MSTKKMILTFAEVFIVWGIIIALVFGGSDSKEECAKRSCDSERAENSIYCSYHEAQDNAIKTYERNHRNSSTYDSTYSNGTERSTSSGSSRAGSSSSSSAKKSTTTRKKSTQKQTSGNSRNSYDEGYDAVYDDDDYDEDRYRDDDDYETGVDDAADELDW